MLCVVERVRKASVIVEGEIIAAIEHGLFVQVGIARGDDEAELRRHVQTLLRLRLFPDATGRLAKSVMESAGDILLVPAFVLTARASGTGRLDFSHAESVEHARALFETLRILLSQEHPGRVEIGRFGAAMLIRAEHEGPVPFVLGENRKPS